MPGAKKIPPALETPPPRDVVGAVGELFSQYSSVSPSLRSSMRIFEGVSPIRKRNDFDEDESSQDLGNDDELGKIKQLWSAARVELKEKTEKLKSLRKEMLHATSSAEKTTDPSEYEAIRKLWVAAKEELRQKTEALNRLQVNDRPSVRSVPQKKPSPVRGNATIETQELRDRLRFTELQLASTRKENDKWSRDFDRLSAQYDEDKRHIRKLQKLKSRVHELEARCEIAESSKEELMTKSLGAMRTHEADIMKKTTLVHDLQDQLEEKAEEYSNLEKRFDSLKHRCGEFESHLAAKDAEASKLAEMQSRLDECETAMFAHQELSAAAEHLRIDNARLVALLASTGEYQEFLQYLEDSKGIAYIPPVSAVVTSARYAFTGSGGGGVVRSLASPKRSRHGEKIRNQKDVEYLQSKFADEKKREGWGAFRVFEEDYSAVVHGDREAGEDADEHKHWMPKEAYTVAKRFGYKHLPHVSDELLKSFLRELNAVWHERERWRISKIREKYKKRVSDLRRMLNHRVPYDHVMQKEKVSRLERNVKGLRAQYLHTPWTQTAAVRSQRHTPTSHLHDRVTRKTTARAPGKKQQMKLVEACLRTIEDVQSQLAEANLENSRLQSMLQEKFI